MRVSPDLAATVAAVIDGGTFDAAARLLHITPSAVSQRIKTLEEQIGRVLLIRSKPAGVTEAGAAVLRMARQVALVEHDTLSELGAGGDAGSPTSVPLAVTADSLATWFLEPLSTLAKRHPIVFELHRDDQDHTAGLLESATVMGAVTSRSIPVAGCRVSPLGAMRYEAVATPAFVAQWLHGVSGTIRDDAFDSAPMIDFDRRDDLQSRWMSARGLDPSRAPRHYVPASGEFAAAVRLGLGWALLPRLQSQTALDAGELVLLGGEPVDVELYWQQWNLRSPLLDSIADEIVREGRRVLAGA
ncbi:MAG: hypothetical protein RI885_121 [Actinomycetota bacterium]